jgi:hypothetical protein
LRASSFASGTEIERCPKAIYLAERNHCELAATSYTAIVMMMAALPKTTKVIDRRSCLDRLARRSARERSSASSQERVASTSGEGIEAHGRFCDDNLISKLAYGLSVEQALNPSTINPEAIDAGAATTNRVHMGE